MCLSYITDVMVIGMIGLELLLMLHVDCFAAIY